MFTATQRSSASVETVGVPSAGSTSTTACRFARGTFIISPTRSAALIAPRSSSTMRSIFARFHASA